jgi:putative endopeptidase
MMTLRPAVLVASLVLAFAAASPAAELAAGLDRAGMDASTRPQDDVFEAMNGTWLKNTKIPDDRSRWGSGAIVKEHTDERLRAIVEDLVAHPPTDPDARRVADLYRAFTDTAALDRAGLAPLVPALHEIDAVRDPQGLLALMGRWQNVVDSPVGLQFVGDAKDPNLLIASLEQSGLGLPDRDYLLKNDERYAKARAAYATYAARLLALAGDAQADAHAQAVLALEKKLAVPMWDRVAMRDPVKMYNPMKADGLARLAPGADWNTFLAAARLKPEAPLVVMEPDYVTALAKLLASEPLDTWKLYLKVRRLDASADVLGADFRDASFAYHGVALLGQAAPRPRWMLGIAEVDGQIGEALGRLYVTHDFPPAARDRMRDLVGNLMKAYSASIDQLTWMSPATKAAAHVKLSKYMLKIGYPDRWRDYGALVVRADDAVGNRDRAGAFEHDRQARRVGGPVDRSEWLMTPQTVDAYYEPSLNEIVFPAAILQSPFFDMKADDAVNYGAIGAIIGHEISHGFDDEGSQYDGDGRLRNWWTDADRQAFEAITGQLAAQYDAYEPLPGKHVNGRLTMGENIADLSGLQISFKAYELSLGGKKSPVIDGLTGEQRFFLGYAQAWRNKVRDEYLLKMLTTDPHSPPRYRAIGATINTDGFHEAFGTKPGDGMWKAPADRIRLW